MNANGRARPNVGGPRRMELAPLAVLQHGERGAVHCVLEESNFVASMELQIGQSPSRQNDARSDWKSMYGSKLGREKAQATTK